MVCDLKFIFNFIEKDEMKFITNRESKKVRHLAASLKSLINQLLIYGERNNVIRKMD